MQNNPWHAEPVMIAAAFRAILLCATTFGWHLTPEQIASVMLAAEAVLAIFTRGSVTTPATIHQAGLTVRGIEKQAAVNKAAEPER